ncbi:hypothetical protein ABW20_dc0100865 [Dactylellina cionopaga]|nr:hypothetical protein ABW20_dc0100865 [Dactylellina cionopaga]
MPSTILPSTLPLELALLTSSTLPGSPVPSLDELLAAFSSGDYHKILVSPLASSILSPPSAESISSEDLVSTYPALISAAVDKSSAHPLELLLLGITALNAYLQTTTTGPPLLLKEATLFPSILSSDKKAIKELKEQLVRRLSVDGEAAYHLLPYPLLFTLARTILNSPILHKQQGEEGILITATWWRLRVNFAHQRILRETAGTVHEAIYTDLDTLESLVFSDNDDNNTYNGLNTPSLQSLYLIERSTIHSFYGYDVKVRKDLETATGITGLQYALTGRLGKRTKFQQDDIAQLVVLAKSKEDYKGAATGKDVKDGDNGTVEKEDQKESEDITKNENEDKAVPKHLDLNDDTLLEAISFTPVTATIISESDLPPSLSSLDPSSQPPLQPMDSIILLRLAESIKNTNPAGGLTREQMSPYAVRVLQHSTNWSIYTMGLLVRSRLEAYKSRTLERSLLQLQVVVDQIVAATASADNEAGVATFLPKPKDEESAGVKERLEYAFPLGLPTRWEVESELAARWVDMGGLRTAVGIYERLGMWAEVALCWAAVEKEEKASGIVRKLLFEGDMPTTEFEEDNLDEEAELVITDEEEKEPVERNPPPSEAPRLWCILGDLEKNPGYYRKAWEVSGKRYARAQRLLGVYYLKRKEYETAIEAYKVSLKINPLNAGSWFQCGCAMLEVGDWDGCVEAFGRVVSIDDEDAEAWSNLATALLRRGKSRKVESDERGRIALDDEEDEEVVETQNEQPSKGDGKLQALNALKRAVGLKNENWRMWENVLVIAASIRPPKWNDMQVAMRKIIDIKSKKFGETSVDVELLDMLVTHVIQIYDKDQPGLPRITVDLVESKVVPLITGDQRLWGIVRRLAAWRQKYSTALEAQEKAFRVVSQRYDVKTDKTSWEELVEATQEMVDAYRNLGPMERTEGLGAGSGEVVMKDWKFKARSSVRNVMGKGRKAGWDEDEALWSKLETLSEELKG